MQRSPTPEPVYAQVRALMLFAPAFDARLLILSGCCAAPEEPAA
jgi:hypothetical protein